MSRPRRTGALVGLALVIGATVAGAASAQAPGPAASASPVEPRSACELLDADATSEVLELPVFRGEDLSGVIVDDDGWLSQCAFFGGLETFLPVLDVTLASGPAYADLFGDLRLEPESETIADLGDEAVLRLIDVWGLDEPVGSLHVRVGETVIGLQLGIVGVGTGGALAQPGDGTRQAEILMDLARMASANMDPASVPITQVCQALSVADAAAVVGMPLVTALDVAENDDWGPACHYADADGRVLPDRVLSAPADIPTPSSPPGARRSRRAGRSRAR